MGNRCWHWSLMESARWQTDTISIHMKPVCSGFFANAWNNASQSMYEGPQWQMNGGSWASLVYDGRQRVCSHRLCVVVLAVCQRSIAIQANLQGCRDGCVCSLFLGWFSCCAAWFCILRVKSEGQIDECIFPGRGAQLWPGMAARELTRYPVARLRMINTSLVGGCFSHPPTMSWRSARTWNLQACGVYFGASPKMMWSRILQTRAATVLVGGCCRRGSRNPPYGGSFVELSAWPSLCEAGELGSCYWMMRRFHGMARCVHLTAALLQAVYRSCLFASVEHIFHWLPLVHYNAWWARARHRIECRRC